MLDIFSGTGAFALEALSRGAKRICMVDIDTSSLLKNIALFPQEQNRIKVIRNDIKKLSSSVDKFDVVFMDAPYNKGLSEIALQNLSNKNWLKNGALCIVELEKTEQISIPSCYKFINERIYGLAKVLFLQYTKQD